MKVFNPEKELKKIQHGNKNKIFLFVISLLIVGVIGYSFALYQIRYSKRIIYTKVTPASNVDLDIVIYVDGKKQNEVPDKGSGYKYLDLSCDKNNVLAMWDEETWGLKILSIIPLPIKCSVYFIDEKMENVKTFDYTGDVQEYTIPKDGLYKIELWGASGGGTEGGKGAYTAGYIELKTTDTLYFYVGGTGGASKSLVAGGYNGGGNTGGQAGEDRTFASGGGATDVRLEKGETWEDFNSLKSRIMVAAGGGGYYYGDDGTPGQKNIRQGGSAGGLIGYDGQQQASGASFCFGTGATQTLGGAPTTNCTNKGSYPNAPFGKAFSNSTAASGGGGGYYGGGRSGHLASGGGGSSFISGHEGCNAINGNESIDIDNIVHTGESVHYSGKKFINTVMIDGEGYYWTDKKGKYIGMPPFEGTSVIVGNTGNGHAKITLIK